MKITYAGGVPSGRALRLDQQGYVQHLMLSWRTHGPAMIYDQRVLRRAIVKAMQERP